jgi:phosphoglucomutase
MDVVAWLRKFELDCRHTNPVDGSLSANRGTLFGEGARIAFRLSGSGTVSATLRVELETCGPDPERHHRDAQAALRVLLPMADQLAGIRACPGRKAPSLVT